MHDWFFQVSALKLNRMEFCDAVVQRIRAEISSQEMGRVVMPFIGFWGGATYAATALRLSMCAETSFNPFTVEVERYELKDLDDIDNSSLQEYTRLEDAIHFWGAENIRMVKIPVEQEQLGHQDILAAFLSAQLRNWHPLAVGFRLLGLPKLTLEIKEKKLVIENVPAFNFAGEEITCQLSGANDWLRFLNHTAYWTYKELMLRLGRVNKQS
ncbi:hypothetical protein IT411_00325 [Candidatus Peregrinibacteria bacterium]|nr:hypothetical protein [Candidatus Peregrinibacteria bacterium]